MKTQMLAAVVSLLGLTLTAMGCAGLGPAVQGFSQGFNQNYQQQQYAPQQTQTVCEPDHNGGEICNTYKF